MTAICTNYTHHTKVLGLTVGAVVVHPCKMKTRIIVQLEICTHNTYDRQIVVYLPEMFPA